MTALILAGLAAAVHGTADDGRVVRLHLAGPHMPRGVKTEVILPPGWCEGEQIPLVLFLHDGWGSERSFRRRGLAGQLAALMRNDLLPRAVVASPRHRGTFLMDGPRGAMESFVALDLIAALEEQFPGAGGDRSRRHVWGISLGGYGAIKLALRRPGVFGRAAALAPWVQSLTGGEPRSRGNFLHAFFLHRALDSKRGRRSMEDNDLFSLVRSADPETMPPLLIVTGGRDRWEPGALALLEELRRHGVDVAAESHPDVRHRWNDWLPLSPRVFQFLLAPDEELDTVLSEPSGAGRE